MNNSEFTLKEQRLLKITDAVLVVCPTDHPSLPKVPNYVIALEGLRKKRDMVGEHSVVRLHAKASKEVFVSDAQNEKTILVAHVTDFAGAFKEYANKEKNAHLAKVLKKFTFSGLSKLNTLTLTTTMTAFASTVENLDAKRLKDYAIDKDWLPTLRTYLSSFEKMQSIKDVSKTNKPKANVNFKSTMADIDGYISTLTNLVIGYKKDTPEFYASCLQALMETKKTAAKKAPAKKELLPDGEKKVVPLRKKRTTPKEVPPIVVDTDTEAKV